MVRKPILFVCTLILLLLSAAAQPNRAPKPSSGSTLTFERAKHLRRGINASQWFAQVYDKRGYTREHFERKRWG